MVRYSREIALSVPPAEVADSVFDEFAEALASRWGGMEKLSIRRALLVAVDVAREMFDGSVSVQNISRAEVVSPIMAYIVDSAEPMITLVAVCQGIGLLQTQDTSMEKLGAAFNISRQAWSKRVDKVCRDLSLPRTGNLRPDGQRMKYAEVHRARWTGIEEDRPRA